MTTPHAARYVFLVLLILFAVCAAVFARKQV